MTQKKPIYVVGFPKSGNTWIARLIAEYLNSNMAPVNAVDAADYSEERTGEYLIYKKHIVEDMQNISKSNTIYIIRDIRDVLISGFFHTHRSMESSDLVSNFFLRNYFYFHIKLLNNWWQGTICSELKIIPRYMLKLIKYRSPKKVRIGNWSKHVKFWSEQDITVIRYEDLLADTESQMITILNAFDIKIDNDLLRKVIENQSFESKRKKFLQDNDQVNSKFLRSGKSQNWKKLLPAKLIKKIEQKHKIILKQYGYKFAYPEEK